MIFREMKSGYLVHYLGKELPLKYGTGKVIAVGVPQIDRAHLNSTQMVIDVTIDIDGHTKTYTVPDSQTICYAPGMVISTDTEGILRELEAMRNQAEEALGKTDYYSSVREQSSELIADLNPVEKEKRETDMRMTKMEGQILDISTKISELLERVKP